MSFFPGFESVRRFNVPILVVIFVDKTGLASVCDGLFKRCLDSFPTLLAVNTSVASDAVACPSVSPDAVALFRVLIDCLVIIHKEEKFLG